MAGSKYLSITSCQCCTVDPKTLNLDPDPGIRPNLDPAPDPVFKVTLLILRKKCLKKLQKKKFSLKNIYLKK